VPYLTPSARQALTDDRRRQILDAALRMFASKGYAGATVRDIARAARVAEGTIYNYFKNKEDVLVHIPRQLAQPVFEQLEAQLAQAATLEDAERSLMIIGQALVARLSANVRFIKVFLSALPHLSPSARESYLQSIAMAAWDIIERHLNQGIERGWYRPDVEPGIAARIMPGMLIMFVIFQEILMGQPRARYPYDAVVRENVRLFLRGVVAGPRPAEHAVAAREE